MNDLSPGDVVLYSYPGNEPIVGVIIKRYDHACVADHWVIRWITGTLALSPDFISYGWPQSSLVKII